MHGHNKGQLQLGGQSFVQRLIHTLHAVCSEVLLITRNPEDYHLLQVPVYTDRIPLRSSLSGIHAGLTFCNLSHAFFTACDTPLLTSDVIRTLMRNGRPEDDVIVPVVGGYYEPLCAVYSTKCLPVIESILHSGRAKISAMYAQMQVRTVPEERILEADPDLDSFINVNTPQDLAQVQEHFARKREAGRGSPAAGDP